MNTHFESAAGTLQLHRWPLNQPNTSLQAWDAADELLIQHGLHAIEQFVLTAQRQPTLLIINDSFGALSCAFAEVTQIQVNDSWLAAQGTLYNRQQNGFDPNLLQQQSSLQTYPAQPDIVLLKLPGNHSYLQYILQQLADVVTPSTVILASAKAKDITRNVMAQFEHILGPTTASLTVKKCRLIQCQFAPKQVTRHHIEFPFRWPLENSPFTLVNHANVFSREKLDQGARFLLNHLPVLETDKRVIDLGCGNGVLGLRLLSQNPQIQLVFCDESYMAVQSAKETVTLNLPHLLAQCEFMVDDCLGQQAERSADLVICNPPFHQQQAVTSHIANQMFNDAKRVLQQGGKLRIVANRHLGYREQLQHLFGHCRQVAADPKFIILEAIKRS